MPDVHIADADGELCDLYRRFFRHHGWQVQTAAGGLECLAQLREGSPNLLILDSQLPWGGADGVLAVMRDDPGLARVPVVLTSTGACPEFDAGLASPPVIHALWKPFSLTALLALVGTELGTERQALTTDSCIRNSPRFCS
jgi:CheY-like chemotaxis protein